MKRSHSASRTKAGVVARLSAGLMAGLFIGSVQAATLSFDIDIPGWGSGAFEYDDGSLFGTGFESTDITNFLFTLNGAPPVIFNTWQVGDYVWFNDGALIGIDYIGSSGADSIQFVSGFSSPGDLGSFWVNGVEQVNPLADANFPLPGPAASVPEPGTWAGSALALLLGGLGWRRRPLRMEGAA